MWTVSLWFFLYLFAINGFCLFLNDVFPNYPIVNPFTGANVTFPAQPTPMNTLLNINGSTTTNATSAGSIGIWETFDFGWNSTIFLYNLITGGFIFTFLGVIIPATGATLIVYGIIQGVLAFFLIITGIHFLRAIF